MTPSSEKYFSESARIRFVFCFPASAHEADILTRIFPEQQNLFPLTSIRKTEIEKVSSFLRARCFLSHKAFMFRGNIYDNEFNSFMFFFLPRLDWSQRIQTPTQKEINQTDWQQLADSSINKQERFTGSM